MVSESTVRSQVMGEDTSGGSYVRARWGFGKHGSDDQGSRLVVFKIVWVRHSRLEADCDEEERTKR